jgi:glutamyl-tRNA synthetase/glutamyl-Q tRNA(Asp) synthetase
MRPIISRFAPAPTGFLHLGHIVNAVYVWGVTRTHVAAGSGQTGRVRLRIEDHDRQRSRPEFEAAILEDLAWLGFEADGAPVRQSDRGDIYGHALDALRRQGLVYACQCSRTEVAQALRPAIAGLKPRATLEEPRATLELRYPGTCADRALAEGPGVGLRVRLAPSVERFVDLRHGPQVQRPSEQCGDLLVRDRDGNWTYQFAATVDDLVQGVTLVIRGDDLLASTGRQMQLARLLGRAEPAAFLHHPLIMKPASAGGYGGPGQKLSKSDGDTGIRELRAKGWTPARVIGRAAWLAGLRPVDDPLAADEVPSLFEPVR